MSVYADRRNDRSVFRRHGTDGGPAGQAGTARRLSGFAGQSRCVPPKARQRLKRKRRENGRRCTAGLCPVRTAHRRHEPPLWGAGGGTPAPSFPPFLREEMGALAGQAPPGGRASTRQADDIRPYRAGQFPRQLGFYQTGGAPGSSRPTGPAVAGANGRMISAPTEWGSYPPAGQARPARGHPGAGMGEPLIRPRGPPSPGGGR